MSGSGLPGTGSSNRAVTIGVAGSLDDLPDDARALLDQGSGLFGSEPWWRTVTAHAMAPGWTPSFAVCRLADRPIAIVPMQSDAAAPHRLAALTTPYTCLFAPSLAPGLTTADSESLFLALGRYWRRAAVTRLDALSTDWPFGSALTEGARRAGLAILRFNHFGNWHETLARPDWEAYLAARSGALRETIRRRLRRTERLTGAAFRLYTGEPEAAAGIAAYESVYGRSWKEPEPFPRFNAALIQATARMGLLRLGVWSIDDTPIAAQFWIREGQCATILKLAHDESRKDLSPGTVLTALMIRHLLEREGVTELDFGRGDDPYKQGWVAERRQRVGVLLVNPWRWAGIAEWARHTAGRLAAIVRQLG